MACLRLRGGQGKSAQGRNKSQWEEMRAAVEAEIAKIAARRTDADESIPSDAVSWGSDASEWNASDLTAAEQAPVRGTVVGRKRERSSSEPGDERISGTSKVRTTSLPERSPARGAQSISSGTRPREHLVKGREAEAGMLVTLSSSVLDEDRSSCDLSSYFKRYHGLVGQLLRPWNTDALAWWARFPGYAEDIFSTGGSDGYQLAHAPKGAAFGVDATASSGSSYVAAAAVAAVLAQPGSSRAKQLRLEALFHNATRSGDLELLSAAVAAGADVNARMREHGNMSIVSLRARAGSCFLLTHPSSAAPSPARELVHCSSCRVLCERIDRPFAACSKGSHAVSCHV